MTEILDDQRAEKQMIRNRFLRLLEAVVLLSSFYTFVVSVFGKGDFFMQLLLFIRSLLAVIYVIWFQVESKAVEKLYIKGFFSLSMNIVSILLVLIDGGLSMLLGRSLFKEIIESSLSEDIWFLLSIIFTGVASLIYIFITRYQVNLFKRAKKLER
jgi:hypothetical protein